MKFGVFDAHCDTLTTLSDEDWLFDAKREFNLSQTAGYAHFTQIMALWVDSARDDVNAKVKKYTAKFNSELALNPNVKQILCISDIEAEAAGTRVIFAIEGGEAIGRTLDGVQKLYDNGVRLITLTWNTPYAISDTCVCTKAKLNGEDDYTAGLTHFGRSVVREMNRLGMMVDVSHLSDKGFYDVAEISEKPFIASHSNARALCAHPRNLTDAMFRVLISKGGVTGINFCPAFLKDGGDAALNDILLHIEHFMSLGGEKSVGIGSDFDGIDSLPKGITGTRDLYKIADALLVLNYSEALVRDIMYGNMERVFKEVLRSNRD